MADVIGGHDEWPLARDGAELDDPDLASEKEKVATESDDQPVEGCPKNSLWKGTAGMLLSRLLQG
jgi:hypothetical protein